MHNKNAISITLNLNNIKFIEDLSKKSSKSKSAVIDQMLDSYRKFKLRRNIISGFQNQTKEDIKESMVDFDNYLEIIDKN